MNILIVEDDLVIGESLTYLLNNEKYNAVLVSTYDKALYTLNNNEYDLIILDVSLPDGNGFDLFDNIKDRIKTPVIFLTALDDELNIVRGLDQGAYDYITKPFKVRELLSRIKNILKRNDIKDIITIKNININLKQGNVTKDNKDLFLTTLEYKILLNLVTNKNQALSREQILSDIWDCNEEYVNDNTLTVYIKRLREKIEDDPNNPKIIITVRGLGYKVEV